MNDLIERLRGGFKTIYLSDLDTAADEIERLNKIEEWLDNNTIHSDAKDCLDCEGIVLAEVSKRIWYHATDDEQSWPFSEVVKADMDNDKEFIESSEGIEGTPI